nr:YdaS family helix-turn-helix protein [Paraburkholderia sp. BCC1885]
MDKLKSFIASLPPEERDQFARRCRTTKAFLRNIAYGQRVAGEKLSVLIERESGGAVTRLDLRPDDWRDIWPELVAKQREAA